MNRQQFKDENFDVVVQWLDLYKDTAIVPNSPS